MGAVLVFNIKNRQKEYAESVKYINILERNLQPLSMSAVCEGYVECDLKQDTYKIACIVEQTLELKRIDDRFMEKLRSRNVIYYFRIMMEKEDDIVNLMYYYLIKQLFPGTLAVLETPGLEYDMKVSAYLSFEMNKDKNTIFIKTDADEVQRYRVVHRLPGSSAKINKEWRLTKFLPLVEVTSETYNFLAGTVEMANEAIARRGTAGNIWEKKVMDTCAGLFSQYHSAKSEKWMQDPQFQNAIKNVPVLTYILFCAFRNHCESRRSVFDLTKTEQELSDARDIAEGLLQILENIIQHSQSKVGYFSFRIHDHQKNAGNSYLNNTYGAYINRQECDEYDTFLEMFVADCFYSTEGSENENILCMKFLENLKQRSQRNKKLTPFIEKYKNLEVKDFFANDTWKEYNAVSDNIIEHYGMQLFDKIVSSCSGCFELVSTDNYEYSQRQYYRSVTDGTEENMYALPGTQYKILLPIKERSFSQEYSGLDFCDYPKTSMLKPMKEHIFSVDIDLENKIIEFNKEVTSDKKYRELARAEREKLLKQQLIDLLSDFIYKELEKSICEDKKYIVHFLMNRIKGARLVEIIFKACLKGIIRARDRIGNEAKIYIAFGNLTKEFISEFCYLMGIYYYKAEESLIMKNTEMYFWENNYCEDLLITGENLKIARTTILKRAVLRGIYPRWIPFINYVWKKYARYGAEEHGNDGITTLPYDVIVQSNGKTIFQNVVEKVLGRPIEHRELGCLIGNTHIQLASKIHISEFYDGQILFLNNYFTNYFSYMIVDKIVHAICESGLHSDVQNIVLVGYEGYSEMLLVETRELLNSYLESNYGSKYTIKPYIIGEIVEKKMKLRSAVGKLGKDKEEFSRDYKDEGTAFAFIVPINSTLTTFERIQFELEKVLEITINEKNTLVNLALIISRDDYRTKCEDISSLNAEKVITEEEREYWKEKNGRIIRTKYKELSVEFLVEVCGRWERASRCSRCFPEKSVCEKPLIKTDISGLSPLTQLGEKRKWRDNCNTSIQNIQRVKKLSEVLTYNHIQRGGNHYLYYFDTNSFFYGNRSDISDWLREVRKCVGRGEKQYSFIVSPLHETNAGFTEEVNQIIFDNTAHVIRLNFSRVFRSNFMMQFSYLQILYNNLINAAAVMNEESEINFYFVDDEIISGKTFMRAKSLIQGLFEGAKDDSRVKVHIFKKIYVLIDRLSDFSKRNFIEEIDNYVSYVKFNISAIQNHDDFCFMCRLVNNAIGYKYMSATNKMDESWRRIEKKFALKDYTWIEKHSEARQDSYRNRMLAAHYAEAEMFRLNENAAVEEYFQIMLVRLFYSKLHKKSGVIAMSDNNREIFISYIKILSRPFFVYRKNAKEAALRLVVIFIEIFLGKEFDELCSDLGNIYGRSELYALYRFINGWREQNDEASYNLLLDLMEQLADMESGFILRRDNMIRIFEAYGKIPEKYRHSVNIREKYRDDFELQYAIFIKQITNEDADETKSLCVENLCLYGDELGFGKTDKVFCGKYGYMSSFGQKILIENTKIIYDGIKFLGELICTEYKIPYSDFVNGNQADFEDIQNNICFDIQNELQKSGAQLKYFNEVLKYYDLESGTLPYGVMFYMLMFGMRTDEILFDHFYKELYRLITGITGARVQILMIPNIIQSDEQLIYPDEPCIIYDEDKERNHRKVIKQGDRPFVESEYLRQLMYEFDTYHISEDRKRVVIKYGISAKHRNEKDYIYLILKYDREQELKSLLFKIRLVLLFRSRTITRMRHDFKNNLFQSLWQTKKHNLLLEHFKNVSHSNPENEDTMTNTACCVGRIDEYCLKSGQCEEKDMGLRIYKAMLLKNLADNNISLLYHEILSQRMLNDYVFPESFSVGRIFENISDLRYLYDEKGICRGRGDMPCTDSALPGIKIAEDVYSGSIYYLPRNSCRSHLIIISLLQNAYKHGNNKETIHIYREKSGGLKKNYPDYLCISNGIDNVAAEEYRKRIEEHIRKPISLRDRGSASGGGEGITLFSVCRYCAKVLEALECSGDEGDAIKFEIEKGKIVFKVPILKGDAKI